MYNIESSLNELLTSVIKKCKKKANNETYMRILNSLENRLSKATWTQYIEIGKTILPHPLLYYSNNDIWKGISILFKLRNQLVHGKNIKATIEYDNQILQLKYSGIYKIAYDYFKEKRVLRPKELNSRNHKILSTRTTNHFVEIGKNFIDVLFYKVNKEQEIDSIGESIAFKENIISDFGIDYKSSNLAQFENDIPDGMPF